MSQEVAVYQTESTIRELEAAKKMCDMLVKMPHYARMGDVGIFAITQKAKSIGMDPIEALNGSLYFVNGKVEMQGQAMLSLIRKAGHSIKMDPKSTHNSVIMHGTRGDNGDTWTATFSIEDAKRAGIFRGQWEKYPQIMCMWRCVSILGRFLFSDVIKGCYVEGEISEAVPFNQPVKYEEPKKISEEKIVHLTSTLENCDEEYQQKVSDYLKRQGVEDLSLLSEEMYDRLLKAAMDRATSKQEEVEDAAGN